MNRLFVLSFEDNSIRTGHRGCFLSKVEIKDCIALIDGRNVFDQHVRNQIKHIKILEKLLLTK